MVVHAIIRIVSPEGVIDCRTFFSEFQYIVGGYAYSLSTIKHGILRHNRRPPYSLVKLFGNGDERQLSLAISKVNPLIHFGVCDGTLSSPVVRFFTAQGVEAELRSATREFFTRTGIEEDFKANYKSLWGLKMVHSDDEYQFQPSGAVTFGKYNVEEDDEELKSLLSDEIFFP